MQCYLPKGIYTYIIIISTHNSFLFIFYSTVFVIAIVFLFHHYCSYSIGKKCIFYYSILFFTSVFYGIRSLNLFHNSFRNLTYGKRWHPKFMCKGNSVCRSSITVLYTVLSYYFSTVVPNLICLTLIPHFHKIIL